MNSKVKMCVMICLLVSTFCMHVNGFTRHNFNNEIDDKYQQEKSQNIDQQLDRRRYDVDASVEDEPSDDDQMPRNFLLIDYLNDGEIERRISFNGITAKQTSIANSG